MAESGGRVLESKAWSVCTAMQLAVFALINNNNNGHCYGA